MKFLVVAAQRFLKDDAGVTAIEYALIAALIALAIIAGVTAVGSNLSVLFSEVAASV
ncbi:Flp family type IVb pilin [Paraburkholderia dinghuensis]|uniref:Flp family type IVb pilin n=1 Tax=Paraburkholderia dinghuensis TaxID=2305225 RepID=A0A3N6MWN4_9BURK|nr:Flp family type IVb pilin [Paraburkholderia dinghuensis]RQH08378.1 Flp family type IVb pilin [Paraburkholderia dinghuensis]